MQTHPFEMLRNLDHELFASHRPVSAISYERIHTGTSASALRYTLNVARSDVASPPIGISRIRRRAEWPLGYEEIARYAHAILPIIYEMALALATNHRPIREIRPGTRRAN